jgi:hypothetical protein
LRAHQAQLLLAAGNPDAEAAPVWRRVKRVKGLTFRFFFWHTGNKCQSICDIEAEQLQPTTFSLYDSSLRRIPV